MPQKTPYLRLLGEITFVGLQLLTILVISLTIRMYWYWANWYPFDNELPDKLSIISVIFFYIPAFLIFQIPRVVMHQRRPHAGLYKKLRNASTITLALYFIPIGWTIIRPDDGLVICMAVLGGCIVSVVFESFCYIQLKSMPRISVIALLVLTAGGFVPGFSYSQSPQDSTFDLQNKLFSVQSNGQTIYFDEKGAEINITCREEFGNDKYELSKTILDSAVRYKGGPNKGNTADLEIAVLIREPGNMEVRILEAGAFPDTLKLKEIVHREVLKAGLPDRNTCLTFKFFTYWFECIEREKKELGYPLPNRFQRWLNWRKQKFRRARKIDRRRERQVKMLKKRALKDRNNR